MTTSSARDISVFNSRARTQDFTYLNTSSIAYRHPCPAGKLHYDITASNKLTATG